MKVPTPPPEARVTNAVRYATCSLCMALPYVPCQADPAGDHLRRWLDAFAAHRITKADLHRVICRLVIVTRWQLVPADILSRPSCRRCGAAAPHGNDLCAWCERAEGVAALAALRSLTAGQAGGAA